MTTQAIVRACGSDSALLGSLGTRESFDRVTTVSPHDNPSTIFDGVRFGLNEHSGSPSTGCAVVECLRLASESESDVVALTESDVGWFDDTFPRRLAPLPSGVLFSAGRSVNSWGSRFEGVYYWGWPIIGSPAAFRKLLSTPEIRAQVGPQYWCHSDRMVTRLSELTYTEIRPLFGTMEAPVSAVGYGLPSILRAARSGIPLFHALKSVAHYEKARTEYMRAWGASSLA